MTLTEFNSMPAAEATHLLQQCNAATAWFEAMAQARPFADVAAMKTMGDAIWWSLGEADYLQAFEAHPMIGDVDSLRKKYAATKAMASGEQSGAAVAAEAVLTELATLNQKYLEKFGFIFIVFATGKSAAEMLGLALHIPDYASGWIHRWAFIARLRADLIRNLGQSAYRAAHKRGGEMDLKATMQTLLGEAEETAPAPVRQPLIEPLSDRELEVLNLIADGLSNRDIAERLVLSVGTVKVHTRNLYGKLNVNSRTQAVLAVGQMNR